MTQDRTDWLNARRTGIGGSEIAAILGLSKWRTPLDVYLSKRGETGEQPDNESMRWGRYLEPVVLQAYSDDTGREVIKPSGMYRHPHHEFMVANLDGYVLDRVARVVEAKTARTAEGWGEPGSDEVPQQYLLQVQHYMEVTATPVADVAVLIGGSDFRVYTVEADRELQDMIIEACAEFWGRVQRGDPPDPISTTDAISRWGRASRAETVVAHAAAEASIDALREIAEARKHLDADEEMHRTVVMRALGERDTLVNIEGRTLATWKAADPAKRFGATAFRQAHPDLAAQYMRTSEPTRRFLLK